MSYEAENFSHANCTIRILQDECGFNPREEYNHVGTIVCFRSRWGLGDEAGPDKVRRDIIINAPGAWTDYYSDAYRDLDDPAMLYQTVHDLGFIVLPLYLYDHSGLTMNTTGFPCPWDSGQVGFIYCTKEDAILEWGKRICTAKVRAQAEKYLRSEVKEYDLYLRGYVWGYIVEHEESGEEDSCSGFIEDYPLEYVTSEAKSTAEWLDSQWQKNRQSRLAELIRNRVPLQYRETALAAN